MTDRMGCAQVEVGLIFLAVLVAQQLHPFPVLHGDHAPLCNAALDSGDDVILLPSKKGSRAAAHEFVHVRTGKHGCMAALAACAHWREAAAPCSNGAVYALASVRVDHLGSVHGSDAAHAGKAHTVLFVM